MNYNKKKGIIFVHAFPNIWFCDNHRITLAIALIKRYDLQTCVKY